MSGLSRREMKRDEVREGLLVAVDWIADHVRAILVGIGAVIVGLIGIWVVLMVLESRAEEAQIALSRAFDVYQAPVVEEGAQPDDVEAPTFASEDARRGRAAELFAEIPEGTDAGRIASIYLGDIAAAEGRFDDARERWQEFVDDHPEHTLAAVVQTSLISLDRQQGRTEELVSRLRGLEASGSGALPRDVLLYELGVTLEDVGQPEEAAETFTTLVEEFPQSPFAAQARDRPSFDADRG